MHVTRAYRRNKSWIEPAFDPDWPELERLQWKAAVVKLDSGIPIEVREGVMHSDGCHIPGYYEVRVGSATAVLDYDDTWSYLNGIYTGAEQQQLRTQENIR